MQTGGLLILAVFAFYAVKLVASFKTGMLAKSWKYVTLGAIILIAAQFPFLALTSGQFTGNSDLMLLGQAMRFIGILSIAVGFREQCKIWRPKSLAPNPMTREITQ